jgi:hypothetical protein
MLFALTAFSPRRMLEPLRRLRQSARGELMKLRCILIRHRWGKFYTDDGERYERCTRCGQYSDVLPPGAKNIAGMA